MQSKQMDYVIITPARNEEDFITFTLESVTSQTITPEQWIIVDDGSTDGTIDVINRYSLEYPWIKLILRDSQNQARSGGKKVIESFNIGYEHLDVTDFGFIVKLDADLSLPRNYFEEVISLTENREDLEGYEGGYP